MNFNVRLPLMYESMKPLRLVVCVVILVVAAWPSRAASASSAQRPPNILVFFSDNLGYGDIGPYGSTLHSTPHLDRFAKEARKFTHFYTAANVCTPSRAGLHTGIYPRRLNLHLNPRHGPVLQPGEAVGLHPSEVTMAEVLKQVGYSTMLVGKWHLGDQPPFLPTRQGFDRYWGIPFSDDMTPREGQTWPPLPLMRQEIVIEAGVDRDYLTQRETKEAIAFIEEHKDRPFFLLISHAMPGSTPTSFATPAFKAKSRNETYGAAVEELDWSAGEVLGAVRRLGLDDNTIVIWTADNSAAPRSRGSNAPLSGKMNSPSEGGMRVPFLARWPGRIPAGTVCDEFATMLDLLPTFAGLTGAKAPGPDVIDGRDVWPLFAGKAGARTPHEAFYFYHYDQLQAVRSGPWKLFVPLVHQRFGPAAEPREVNSAARLFHVVDDPAELKDVAAANPEIVARLNRLAENGRREIGDLNLRGRGDRPAGFVLFPEHQRLPAAR
jgi:arylsulfatase A-like enzyme